MDCLELADVCLLVISLLAETATTFGCASLGDLIGCSLDTLSTWPDVAELTDLLVSDGFVIDAFVVVVGPVDVEVTVFGGFALVKKRPPPGLAKIE